MVSAAIGLSKQGLIPIVDTFAQFGITKGNLPFIMAGLSEGPVIALFLTLVFKTQLMEQVIRQRLISQLYRAFHMWMSSTVLVQVKQRV